MCSLVHGDGEDHRDSVNGDLLYQGQFHVFLSSGLLSSLGIF
jgi:hypothetical protein